MNNPEIIEIIKIVEKFLITTKGLLWWNSDKQYFTNR